MLVKHRPWLLPFSPQGFSLTALKGCTSEPQQCCPCLNVSVMFYVPSGNARGWEGGMPGFSDRFRQLVHPWFSENEPVRSQPLLGDRHRFRAPPRHTLVM